MYEEAETFLILKYGSIAEAYRAFMVTGNPAEFSHATYEILMEYEHDMYSDIGPMSEIT